MARSNNAQVSRYFDKTAPKYDRSMRRFERWLLGRGREWAVERADGDVLDLAVGTGLSFPYYPLSARVVGVDLSEQMLVVARNRIAELGIGERARVERGDVQALDFPDDNFDTVVSNYTLCTIPDPAAAAREAFRVLRPGGRFLLVEHGPSTSRVIRCAQKALNPLFVRFQADHITRDPVPYLKQAGFQIDELHHGGRMGIAFRVAGSMPALAA